MSGILYQIRLQGIGNERCPVSISDRKLWDILLTNRWLQTARQHIASYRFQGPILCIISVKWQEHTDQ